MFKKHFQNIVRLVIAVSLLAGCMPQPTSEPDGTNTPSTPTMEPQRPPEPPLWVLSLPVSPDELAEKCGPYEVASLSAAPMRSLDDCAELFRHGLRPKRIREFAEAGVNIASLFTAMASGEAVFEYMGKSEIGGEMLGVLVAWGGHKIFVIFGGTQTPTLFPLPWIKKGETMVEALVRISRNFPVPVLDESNTAAALRTLANCVRGRIETEGEKAVEASPEAEAIPTPIPVPEGTPVATEVPAGVEVDVTSSFASTDPALVNLSPDEVAALITIGVIVVVVIVVVVLASGGSLSLPLLALAAAA